MKMTTRMGGYEPCSVMLKGNTERYYGVGKDIGGLLLFVPNGMGRILGIFRHNTLGYPCVMESVPIGETGFQHAEYRCAHSLTQRTSRFEPDEMNTFFEDYLKP